MAYRTSKMNHRGDPALNWAVFFQAIVKFVVVLIFASIMFCKGYSLVKKGHESFNSSFEVDKRKLVNEIKKRTGLPEAKASLAVELSVKEVFNDNSGQSKEETSTPVSIDYKGASIKGPTNILFAGIILLIGSGVVMIFLVKHTDLYYD